MPRDSDSQKLNRHKTPARRVEKGFEYVAVKDDTISGVISNYNKTLAPRGMQTSGELVRRANPGIHGERLAPGQKLFIPTVQARLGKAREKSRTESRTQLAQRIASLAEESFRAGQFASAYARARAALHLDPQNPKASYYFELLEADTSWRSGDGLLTVPRPYYPTLPPRPVHDH